jgi:CRP-like cAMP-binding protein
MSARMNIPSLLESFDWFVALSAEYRQVLVRTTLLRHFEGEQVVAHRGSKCAYWIGVYDGFLKATSNNADGKVFSDILAIDGEWTGEAEIILERERLYDVVTVEESLLVLVPAGSFRWLVENDIRFANFAVRQLAARAEGSMKRMERARQLTGIQEVARAVGQVLIRSMRKNTANGTINLRLSQNEIAEMSLLSRQTVNQAIRELEARGLVLAGYNKVVVLDRQRLREFAK